MKKTIALLAALLAASLAPAAQNVTVEDGGSIRFAVTAAGTQPFTYAWRKSGAVVPGQSGSSYTISPVRMGDAGTYTVTVSNAAGATTSEEVVVTVKASLPSNVTVTTTVNPPSVSVTPSQ